MAQTLQSPGSYLAGMLEKYKLNPFKLSKDIHLSQSAVRLIVIGKTKITVPVAMRLAQYFNTNPEYFLTMQMRWDLSEAAKDKELAKLIKSIPRVQKPTAGGKEKAAAEKKAAEANAAASEAIATANALKSEAASEIKKAQSLYYQQTNLNALYRQAVSDRDRFKVMADKAAEMEAVMKGAYSNVGSMAKAINAILYDPALIIEGLTPPQERLLKAIPNYAVTWAKKAGLTEIAEDIEKHYEISPGIQKHIDELTPKPKRNKSYGHSL
ncbi:MAG TPA: addiction module antidote protein, HigA family [Ruminococcaceae bacterium]|nr:addiction module antidote protein, HigA family [Oscillospiraceae bacterium]